MRVYPAGTDNCNPVPWFCKHPSNSPPHTHLTHPSSDKQQQQLVDKLDAGDIPADVCGHSYQALYRLVSQALFQAHVEGKLKAEIVQEPEKYVELDPDMAQTLLDQAQSGKKLLLITNSDYLYTQQLMSYAYDRFLPSGMKWRDLFDMVWVGAFCWKNRRWMMGGGVH